MNGRSIGGAWLALLIPGIAAGQVTSRVSVGLAGAQANGDSYPPSISADGRFVAFRSFATNLVAGDTNGKSDIFVRDRLNGTTERVSVDSAGTQGDQDSGYLPSISADGRYVAFASAATNLVAGDTNGAYDVFVRDRLNGTTERVSLDSAGTQGDQDSGYFASISADGQHVAFASSATTLVTGDTNGVFDVFVRDRQSGTTERMSVDSAGTQADGDSGEAGVSISADGRRVAFGSYAANLVTGDTFGLGDVFVRDRQSGTTERVSVDSAGVQANSVSMYPSISADGRYVAFSSWATHLVVGDTNSALDVFVRDLETATTERVSLAPNGDQADHDSWQSSISADGRWVAFMSDAENLADQDTNKRMDVFVRDRQTGTTELVSIDAGGVPANGDSLEPSISADGRFVAFRSQANDLVAGDTGPAIDVFVRDRFEAPSTSLCEPGVGGVIGCPCSNSPWWAGHGCNNSAMTGGATLQAAGVAELSQDSLVFTTSGERATATSVLLQGTSVIAAGTTYGQGVRCVGGILKRLFTKTASGGSITAPDFGAGDPTVSARSAAKGNVIGPGESRWYLVFYRDPIVLGGCPSTSTFDATQTRRVEWNP